MVAGGTGLAPMMSMLDHIRAQSGIKPPILLSFGCKDAGSLFHRDELDLRALWMPTLDLRVSVDDGPDDDPTLRIGNPVTAVRPEDIDNETVAYLCGPPTMIEAAHSHLINLGVRADRIYAEQFVAME